MALHIKKNDMVQIIAGDYKGATGRVLRLMPREKKVIVQGHNLAKKHVKPSQRNPQGGRITVEQPIHISNVLPVNSKTSRATRVKYRIKDDGSKHRICLDGSEISVIRKSK
ncbi:MAG: 50S ribosomal protein L24 [Sedimentisphaerales bacterium]|nr:50S ribosomal protein L24 [Sedimentisphaerales bacterium]